MNYILTVEGYKPILGILEAEPSLQLYRWPHDVERINFNLNDEMLGMRYRGNGIWTGPVRDAVLADDDENPTRAPMPEVNRVLPDQTTPLHDWAIRLYRAMNDELSDEKFCTLFGNKLFLTNGTGWPGRRNIILGQDLNAGFPNFHAPLVTGGALFKGREVNGWLEIENIRYNQPVTLEYVLERPWLWFWGTSVTSTGRVNMIVRKNRQGIYVPVRIPFITKYPVRVPLNWLHKLKPGYVPNVPHTSVNKFATLSGEVTGQL